MGFQPTFIPWILLLGILIPVFYQLELFINEKKPESKSRWLLNSELMSSFANGIELVLA